MVVEGDHKELISYTSFQGSSIIFCYTALRSSGWWAQLTIKLFGPIVYHRKNNSGAVTRTLARLAWSMNATSVPCQPPRDLVDPTTSDAVFAQPVHSQAQESCQTYIGFFERMPS